LKTYENHKVCTPWKKEGVQSDSILNEKAVKYITFYDLHHEGTKQSVERREGIFDLLLKRSNIINLICGLYNAVMVDFEVQVLLRNSFIHSYFIDEK